MSSKKYQGAQPTVEDILNITKGIARDFGLTSRQTMTPTATGELKVRVESFRETNGVRIGIAAYEEVVSPAEPNLTPAVYRCYVRVYWATSDLAYADPKGKLHFLPRK